MPNIFLGLFKKAFQTAMNRLCIAQQGITGSYLLYNSVSDSFATVNDPTSSTSKTIPSTFSTLDLNTAYPRILTDFMFPSVSHGFNFSNIGSTNQCGRYPLRKEAIVSSQNYSHSNIFFLDRGSDFSDNPYQIVGPYPYFYNYANKDNQKILSICVDSGAYSHYGVSSANPMTLELWEANIDLDSPVQNAGISCVFSKVAGADFSTALLGPLIPANVTSFRVTSGVFNENANEFSLIVRTTQDVSGVDVYATSLVDGEIIDTAGALSIGLTALSTAAVISPDYITLPDVVTTGNKYTLLSGDYTRTPVGGDECNRASNYSGSSTLTQTGNFTASITPWSYSREFEIDYNGATKHVATQHFSATYSQSATITAGGSGTSTGSDSIGIPAVFYITSTASGEYDETLNRTLVGEIKNNGVLIYENFRIDYSAIDNMDMSESCSGTELTTFSGTFTESLTIKSCHFLYADLRHDLYLIEEKTLTYNAIKTYQVSITGVSNYSVRLIVKFKGVETVLHTKNYGDINHADYLIEYFEENSSLNFKSMSVGTDCQDALQWGDEVVFDIVSTIYCDGIGDVNVRETAASGQFLEDVNLAGSQYRKFINFPLDTLYRILGRYYPDYYSAPPTYNSQIINICEFFLNPGPDAWYNGENEIRNPFHNVFDSTYNPVGYTVKSAACDGDNYIIYMRQNGWDSLNTDGTKNVNTPNAEKVIFNGEYLDPASNTKNIPDTGDASITFVI